MSIETRSILVNVLSYMIKKEDAPMSAETHLYSAVAQLLSLNPNFKTDNQEMIELIEEIRETHSIAQQFNTLAEQQEPLGKNFEKILTDNLWELYD